MGLPGRRIGVLRARRFESLEAPVALSDISTLHLNAPWVGPALGAKRPSACHGLGAPQSRKASPSCPALRDPSMRLAICSSARPGMLRRLDASWMILRKAMRRRQDEDVKCACALGVCDTNGKCGCAQTMR